jgi:hypothetical protein
MEILSSVVSQLAERQDSIFYFLLMISGMIFVIAEAIGWLRRRRSSVPHQVPNPRAPLGWSLLPALLLISLAFVRWRKDSPITTSEAPFSSFVSYER